MNELSELLMQITLIILSVIS